MSREWIDGETIHTLCGIAFSIGLHPDNVISWVVVVAHDAVESISDLPAKIKELTFDLKAYVAAVGAMPSAPEMLELWTISQRLS